MEIVTVESKPCAFAMRQWTGDNLQGIKNFVGERNLPQLNGKTWTCFEACVGSHGLQISAARGVLTLLKGDIILIRQDVYSNGFDHIPKDAISIIDPVSFLLFYKKQEEEE